MFDGIFQPTHLIVLLLLALLILPFWKIFSRAGFAGPLALLMVVPFANVIVLFVVAYGRWRVAPEDARISPN